MPPTKPRLRKREIVLAVAAGGLAAAAAAAILDDSNDGAFQRTVIVAGPENFDNLAPFQSIETVGPQDVVITYGDAQSVRAEGSPEARALMGVVVEDGVLKIRPRTGGWQWNWGGINSATYYVTLPRLNSVTLNGSGDIRIDKAEGDAFTSIIEGSGDLSIGSLKVDRAAFTITGSGSITAAGTARDTQVTVSGPGDLSARALQTKTASILVNGPGDVKLSADEHVNGSINGPGDVDISGSAQCTISEAGPGDVDCEGGNN